MGRFRLLRAHRPCMKSLTSTKELLKKLHSSANGISEQETKRRQKIYGKNQVKTKVKDSNLILLLNQFKSPFVIILLFACIFSYVMKDNIDSAIIFTIIFFSSLLGFFQEKGARDTVRQLLKLSKPHIVVIRDSKEKSVHFESLVPGDIILLKSGDMVPADCVLIEAKDLMVDEAILTGESIPVEKHSENSNVFNGTNVICGTAKALVVTIGKETEFGKISEKIAERAPQPAFQQRMIQFGLLLMTLTVSFMVAIFILNVIVKHPIFESMMFSLAIAVGFTPQLLPLVMTVNLAQGAKHMVKKKVIVKKLNSIENFGSMNILCCDKTGTLTESKVELYSAVNCEGKESPWVHAYAYVNAHFQSGYPNPLDDAILRKEHLNHLKWEKLDEIPYDFKRSRLSILAKKGPEVAVVTKGAFQNILAICSKIQVTETEIADLRAQRGELEKYFTTQSQSGFRVLGIAYKKFDHKQKLNPEDETDLIFLGFLLFYDPPKPKIAETLKEMVRLGIKMKILTGDNPYVAAFLAKKTEVLKQDVVVGKDLENLKEEEFNQLVLKKDVFAEVSPLQKEQIIRALKKSGAIVGYLGDGLNDAPAFHVADVGISVSSAAPFIKARADIVLVEKRLRVLIAGVKEGRRTVANTLKYILMAISANFGNMFSMSGASLFLSFLPLLPKQILLNNLMTDCSVMSICTDNIDTEMEEMPWKWDIKRLKWFMLIFGIASSVFDYMMFFGLLFIFKAGEPSFQTAWFIESVLSASLIIFFIRSQLPFYKSKPSKTLIFTILGVCAATIALPWTRLGKLFNLIPLPLPYFLYIFGVLVAYAALVEAIKYYFLRVKKFNFISSKIQQ
jgi:Mg2+-importing ATPase